MHKTPLSARKAPRTRQRVALRCAAAVLLCLNLNYSAAQATDTVAPPEPLASAPAPAKHATTPIPTTSQALRTKAMVGASTALLPPDWASLDAAQKAILSPLARDWDSLEAGRKSKWLEVAARFPTLPAAEQSRMRERMRDWSRLSAAERQQARAGFQAAQQLNAGDRQAKWEAYQALPAEKRQQLVDKASKKQAGKKVGIPSATANESQAKSNLVPAASKNSSKKAVAPSLLQAKPGASTILITQTAIRPSHLRAGQTKVWADPSLVDSKTLLPKQRPASAP